MAGRGRGRGRGALNFDSLKKPVGVTTPEKDDPTNDLANMIDALDVTAPSVNAVTQCAAKSMSSDDSMEEILKLLIGRCNKDWHFAKQAAIICRELVSRPENGKTFRSHLLRTMQSHFKQKDTMRDDSASEFLGAMAFMCQNFALLRSETGDPFIPLVKPVMEVLDLMLEESASDQEQECAVAQLRALVSTMYSCDSSHRGKYDSLITVLRNDIINCRGSRELREKMLQVIEENAAQSR